MSENPFEDVSNDIQSGSDDVSLSIGDLVASGVKFATSTTGLQVLGVVVVVNAITQVLTAQQIGQVVTTIQTLGFDVPAASNPPAVLSPELPVFVTAPTPILLGFVVQVAKIGAVRSYAAGEFDGLRSDTVGRELLTTTLKAFFGGVLLSLPAGLGGAVVTLGFGLGISTGVVAGIVFGVVLVAVWVLAVFFLQEVAISDEGITGGISGSVSLTAGHRWSILGLGLVLFVLSALVSAVSYVSLLFVSWVVYAVAAVGAGGFVSVLSLGAITEAWTQLDDGRTEDGSTPSEVSSQWEDGDEWVTSSDDSWNQNDSEWS